MTEKALKKLTDLQRETLTTYREYYRRNSGYIELWNDTKDKLVANGYKYKILGYLEALKDTEHITEQERKALAIYFTLK